MTSKWLTQQEAALHARVSVKHLRRMVAIGRLPPPARFGRRILWDAATLDAAIAGTSNAPSDPIMAAIHAARAATTLR